MVPDVRRIFTALGGAAGCTVHVEVIADLASLEYHRPRAPSVSTLLCCPTTSTWSRSRRRGTRGPPPTRSATWPWGVPWLSPGHRDSTEHDNDSLRLCISVADCVLEYSAITLLAFPEQYGSTDGDRPASPWDLREVREWASKRSLWRIAFRQCELGPSARPRPTGALINASLRHASFYYGWPDLHRRDDGTWRYQGPLPHQCSCQQPHERDSTERPLSRPPLETAALESLANLLLRRALPPRARGHPAGKGDEMASSPELLEDDSDDSEVTWLSDAGETRDDTPIDYSAAREAQLDPTLCKVLNLGTKDATHVTLSSQQLLPTR